MADIFCKIIAGGVKGEALVAEGKEWVALKDINPQAPVHILIMPKQHLSGLSAAKAGQERLLGRLLLAANTVANKLKLGRRGFRLIVNCGSDAGQTVPHLHIHLIGGRKLGLKVE